MEFLSNLTAYISDFMYTYILIILLLIAGIYFTFKTGFVQIRLFWESIKQIGEKTDNENAMSSFQTLMISTASRVGVGNISGVATAVSIGGPGAIFWMWIIALIGAASAFIESTLAQVYKIKSNEGFKGGPSFYIEKALKNRTLGVLFSIFLIFCFGYGFNALQSNTIASLLDHYVGTESVLTTHAIIGIVVSLIIAYIIFGGDKKIAKIMSIVVPLMAIIYLTLGFLVIFKNFSLIGEMIALIFNDAFNFESIFGGFAGSCVLLGIKRGLFSNEAGMGSAPNVAASADVSHPVKQGLVQMVSVFIDTLVICTISAFIILLSDVNFRETSGIGLVQKAVYSQFGDIGIIIITISVFFFAISSIIGNYYYTESNMLFIFKNNTHFSKIYSIYRVSVLVVLFMGAIAGNDIVWNFADITMGLMALINLPVIFYLSGTAKRVLNDYLVQKKEGKNPVFLAKSVGLNDLDCWN